ncbi:MAG: hypothetical protein HUU35_12585 [Armatimonadetes bacterium]|nr:hypothetical protein [Armatimonadota bacterium]
MLKSCSAGCLSMIGAFLVAVGFSQISDGGSFALLLFFLSSAGVPLWLAWSLQRSAMVDMRRQQELRREWQERQILRIAAAHDGRVTPSLVAMHSGDIGLEEARRILQQLAVDGYCTCDSDSQGTLYYEFDLGGEARPRERLSAEEWVESMSQRRMTGHRGEQTQYVDE